MRYPRSLMLPFSILMLLLTATPSISQQRPTISSYGTMRVMFEIELQGTDDTHYLYDEAAIGVLGTVQQTPRYGVNGEAWVHGMWMKSHFFDTTLSDRFVVKCTEEEAISMSIYPWVEWTAPILEGTTYDGESSIFFEYGAESGALQPPWDHAGPGGNGDKSVSNASVASTSVRTGSKSVELYVKPPPNSDSQRRVGLTYASTTKEFYSSWWAYFPSGQGWEDPDVDGWGTTIGGMQPFWGPAGVNKWKYYTSARFGWSQSSRVLHFVYSFPYDPSQDGEWNTNYYIGDYLDTWVHFEVYLKWTNDTSGVVRAWFNGNLVAEKTGLKSDPTGYPEFVEENCIFAYGYPYPTIRIELYQSQNSPEHWYFIDDVIGATERVSQTHGVYDDYY